MFLQGYRNREIFIATQAPIKESIEDFWRMIWEYECYVLVMLVNVEEDEQVRNLFALSFTVFLFGSRFTYNQICMDR